MTKSKLSYVSWICPKCKEVYPADAWAEDIKKKLKQEAKKKLRKIWFNYGKQESKKEFLKIINNKKKNREDSAFFRGFDKALEELKAELEK